MAGSDEQDKGSILAYFSHSYREADREVNVFFWHLFCQEGFFFTVDPQSQFFSIPYLESMMALSNCFVAVIPKRKDGYSPYIRFEYGLAVQAQKPWIIFVEQGLSSEAFARDRERVLPFNRKRLAQQESELRRGIARLADQVRGDRNPDVRLKQPAGFIVGSSAEAAAVYTPELIKNLKDEMAKHERSLKTVAQEFDPTFELCFELEKYDFLIMEMREALQAPWLAAYVLGRATPCVRVCHLRPGETPESVALPPIVARHRPEKTGEEPVVYWRDQSELIAGVLKHVDKFATERIEFHHEEDGLRYFMRAGRHDGRVFISNAASANSLARELIAGLRLESIDFFHYQIKNAIAIGEEWLEKLEAQIGASRVFVAFLTPEYLQSEWCLFELQVALRLADSGTLQVHPYILDEAIAPNLLALGLASRQVYDVSRADTSDIVKDVVRNVDAELRKPDAPAAAKAAAPPAAAAPPQPGLTEAERLTLVEILEARLTVVSGREGLIRSILMRASLYRPLAGEDYSGSANAAASTLVTNAEALGLRPEGKSAIVLLVLALRKGDLISHEHIPFLDAIVARLDIPSSERS
jgi:hypothetical protein